MTNNGQARAEEKENPSTINDRIEAHDALEKKTILFRLAKVVYIGFFSLFGLWLAILWFESPWDDDNVAVLVIGIIAAIVVRKAFYYIMFGKSQQQ